MPGYATLTLDVSGRGERGAASLRERRPHDRVREPMPVSSTIPDISAVIRARPPRFCDLGCSFAGDQTQRLQLCQHRLCGLLRGLILGLQSELRIAWLFVRRRDAREVRDL